jgi:large subunit ribosomal protein L30
VRIRLRRSLIGVPRDQRATVYALGLRKIGDAREVADTRDVRGMVDKVAYLLDIDGAAAGSGAAATKGRGPA